MQFACTGCGKTLGADDFPRCATCGHLFLDPFRGCRRMLRKMGLGTAEDWQRLIDSQPKPTVCGICHLPLNARGWCPVHHLGAERKRG